jgi:hypothetical protein
VKETFMPFLYLPDVVSLALLLITLNFLRRSAVEHFRQELLKIHNDMILYCCDIGLPFNHPACLHIRHEISLVSGMAEKISPARMLFIHRILKRASANESSQSLAIGSNLERKLSEIENHKIAEKLRGFQLEINLSLGSMFLLGSISGWMLSAQLLFKIAFRKAARRPKKRINNPLDLAEKLISRLGQQTLMLIFASTKALNLPPILPASKLMHMDAIR